MKILLINGSPRGERSSSLKLSKSFVEGMKEKEEIELTQVNLSEKNIRQCIGCFSCWKDASHQCVLHDEMSSLLPFLIRVDVVIYSFPLYSFSLPALLKNFLDRSLPLYEPFMVDRKDGCGNGGHPCRYDLSKQRTVLISTCGFYTSEGNYDSVTSMFHLLKGKNRFFSIFVGQGELFSVPALKEKTNQYLDIVKRAGAEFVEGEVSEKTKEELSVPLYPKEVFEKMADSSWGMDSNDEKMDEGYVFLKQTCALYNPKSYAGKEIAILFEFTDIHKEYEMILTQDKAELLSDRFLPFSTKIITSLSVWKGIGEGKIKGDQALFEGKYRVEGDFTPLMNWGNYFFI